MEDLNKLSYRFKNVNENKISKPANKIKFKLDQKGDLNLYYFKVLQIVPLNTRKSWEVILYLKTDTDLNDGIYKLILNSFPIIKLDKIIPGYVGKLEELSIERQYIVKYQWFEKYTKINLGLESAYIVLIGYPTQLRWEKDYALRLGNGIFIQDIKITEKDVNINRDIEGPVLITTKKEIIEKLKNGKYPNGRDSICFISTPEGVFD